MSIAAAPGTSTAGAARFGTGRLFLADSRLGLLLLSDLRHRAVRRVFGVSRQDANLITFVLALSAASATYGAARRVVRTPLAITGGDATIGAFLMRETAIGMAGPSARTTPMFGMLLTAAMVGGIVLPGLRRAAHAASQTERRLRVERIRRYVSASRDGTP